jgi:hypothetical protein
MKSRSLAPCHPPSAARWQVTAAPHNTVTENKIIEVSHMKRLRKKISRSAKDLTDDEINRWTKSNDVLIGWKRRI